MSEKLPSGYLNPTEFARKHALNRYNVYYWMKSNNLGHKRGSYWFLTPEDQETILHISEQASANDSGTKKKGTSRRKRFNSQMSVEAIYTELAVDMDAAILIKHLTINKRAKKLLEATEAIAVLKSEHQNRPQHELVLLLIGALLKKPEIRVLQNEAEIDVYKYLAPVEEGALTLVFDLHANTYYLASPTELERQMDDVGRSEKRIEIDYQIDTPTNDLREGDLFGNENDEE